MEVVRIVVFALMAWMFIVGLKGGLIRQILEVVGIVVAFLAAFYFAHALAAWIEGRASVDYWLALALSAAMIFTGIVLAVHFLGVSLQKLLKLTVLGIFDRLAGGLFGALKVVLMISLALSLMMVLPVPDKVKNQVRDDPVTGRIYPVLPVMYDMIASVIPGSASFEQIARITESDAVRDAKKKIDNIKKDVEKSKERLEGD